MNAHLFVGNMYSRTIEIGYIIPQYKELIYEPLKRGVNYDEPLPSGPPKNKFAVYTLAGFDKYSCPPEPIYKFSGIENS